MLFGLFGCSFFCCLGGDVFFFVFLLLFGRGRGRGARPNSKNKSSHRPNSKNINTPRPFRACCFFAVWAGGRVYFFAVWAGGRDCFVCCFGAGRVFFGCLGWWLLFFFALLVGRGTFFLAVWAGSCFPFFCCLGGCRFFLLFGRGTGIHSLTGLPGSSLRDPITNYFASSDPHHGNKAFTITCQVRVVRFYKSCPSFLPSSLPSSFLLLARPQPKRLHHSELRLVFTAGPLPSLYNNALSLCENTCA